jgi:hypothetical protein
LKGLVVIDNVAYFGIAPHAERQARTAPDMHCELAAVHLVTHQLVFRRQVRLGCLWGACFHHLLLNVCMPQNLSCLM